MRFGSRRRFVYLRFGICAMYSWFVPFCLFSVLFCILVYIFLGVMIALCVSVIRWTSCGYSADFSSCRTTFVRSVSSSPCIVVWPARYPREVSLTVYMVWFPSCLIMTGQRFSCVGFTVPCRTDCPGRASVFILYVWNNKRWYKVDIWCTYVCVV